MLFEIEARNPYSGETEHYAVAAENETNAKIIFSQKYPSFKIRDVYYIEGSVTKMER